MKIENNPLQTIKQRRKFNGGVVRPSLIALAVAQAVIASESQAATIQTGPGCNLASAIISANNDEAPSNSLCVDGSGVDTIELNGGVRLTAAINGATGLPVITSPLTINGNGRVIRRDASADPFRILEINTARNVTLSDLTITNGLLEGANEVGAGILVKRANRITLENVTVTNNSAAAQGGGLGFFEVINATIKDSVISNNSSATRGGGIFSAELRNDYYYAALEISRSTINNNSAISGGGVAMSAFDRLRIDDSTLRNNSAEMRGGAIFNKGTTVLLGSTVSQNTASMGGGVFVRAYTFSRIGGLALDMRSNGIFVKDSTLSNNTATGGNGGAVSADGDDRSFYSPWAKFENSVISDNRATGSGGGISVSGGYIYHAADYQDVALTNTIVSGNSAGEYGGAINGLNVITPLYLGSVKILNNHATLGGGGVRVEPSNGVTLDRSNPGVGELRLVNSVVSGNSTEGSGGAVLATDRRSGYCNFYSYSYGSCDPNTVNNPAGVGVYAQNSTISGNSAVENGGGIATFTQKSGAASIIELQSTTLTGNSAAVGGGVFSAGAQLTVSNTLLAGNVAGRRGSEITRNRRAPSAVLNGHNLFGSSEQSNAQAFSNFVPDATDITATSDGSQPTPLNQIIEPLSDNGGDTLTHALVANSLAIDSGLESDCPFNSPYNSLSRGIIDQRGFLRTDGACDIGAYELFSQNIGFSVSASNVIEGEDANAVFRIELSEPQAVSVGYDFRTEAVTAIDGEDYVGRSGRIIFPAGTTVRERRVEILEDNVSGEADETFSLIVTDINDPALTISTEVTISESDALPVISAAEVRVEEGRKRAEVEMTLSKISTEEVRVRFATVSPQGANNPASDGDDYVSRSGFVVFQPGQTRKTRSITLIDDNISEANELFRLDLSDALNATISPDSERVKIFILDDD